MRKLPNRPNEPRQTAKSRKGRFVIEILRERFYVEAGEKKRKLVS
jgi:hypothetical protein